MTKPDLADELIAAEARIECKQCSTLFTPRNINHIYHSQQCRLDHANQRTAEESRRRQETGFAWDPIRPAARVHVKLAKRAVPIFHVAKGWKTAVVLPDQQVGYRRFLDDGILDPFHDPRAIDIAEQICEAERPDQAVMTGDLNDNPTWGRWGQEPEYIGGVQPGIDRASVHVATVSETAKETAILSGNHDARIENQALANALASAGMRRARRSVNEFPVQTMPFLLGIAEMKNVKWVGAYPAGAHYINDNLAVIHGRVTGKSIGEKVINSERVSVIHGHTHGFYDYMATFNRRGRPNFVRAYSPGCLCRIDGHVPSVKSGRDPFGRPVTAWENWQQGCLVIRYLPGDGKFHFEDVRIDEGEAMFRGQIFTSKKTVDDPELSLHVAKDA